MIPGSNWSFARFVAYCALLGLLALGGCATAPTFDAPRRLEAQGRLMEALRVYEQMALTASGANRTLIAGEIQRVRSALTQETLVKATNALGTKPTLPSVESALRVLSEAAFFDDAQGRIAAERTRLEGRQAELRSKYAAALNRAEQAATREEWTAALVALSEASEVSGGLPELRSRERDWLLKRDTGFARSVRQAITARDLPEAERRLAAAQTSRPAVDAAFVSALAMEVLNLRRELFVETQRQLIDAKRFFTVHRNLIGQDYPAAREVAAEVREKGAEFYLASAQQERDGDASRLGFAYLAAAKAKELAGERDDVFKVHRDLSDAIDDFITLRVAVASCESPVDAPGLGSQVSDALITYLVDHLPYGVRVIERAQTDSVLRGKESEIASIGERLKADIVVVGNVSSLSIERKRSEREVTEVVQVGLRKQPNPLHAQMAAKHGPNTATWPFAVPAMIDGEPITETIRYKQGEEVLNGVMVAYVRSFEATRNTVTQSREFSATERLKDTYRDAVRIANIQDDPLDLPTDNEVRERLRSKLVSEIAAEILKRYVNREQRYLKDAETAAERRDSELVALNLASALHYCMVAAGLEGGPTTEAIKKVDRSALLEFGE